MGLFSGFRKPPKLKTAVDLSVLGTDFHSHLIPGIDDGVKTMDEAMDLIEVFISMGYTRLITTPHIMTDYYRNTASIIEAGLDDLRRAVASRGLDIQLEAAAEYMIDIGFEEKLKNKELLTFGKNHVLIEFSYLNPPGHYKQLIFDLRTEGYKVVLAHPERYSYWHEYPSVFEDLIDRGVFLQLNLVSLAGFYGEDVRKMAQRLIDMQAISYVGSDMHNIEYMDAMRSAQFEPFLEKLIGSGNLLNADL